MSDDQTAALTAKSQYTGLLRKLHAAAGAPSWTQIARAAKTRQPPVNLPKSSWYDWLNGASVPANDKVAAFLVSFLRGRARKSAPDDPFPADERWEKLRLTAVAESRSEGRKGGRPRQVRPAAEPTHQLQRYTQTEVIPHAAAYSQSDELSAVPSLVDEIRERALAAHGRLEVIHIGRRVTAPLAALYVERRVADGAGTEVALQTLLRDRQRVVLLGDPGVGKSTLVNQLALTLAAGAACPGRVTPVMLTIREHVTEIQEARSTMAQLVSSAVRRRYDTEASAGALQALIADGSCVLIVDGLDELTPIAARIQFVSRLEQFVDQYPSAWIVVTCRAADYQQAALSRDKFTSARLEGLSDRQVEEYATRWLTVEAGKPPNSQDVTALVRSARTYPDLHGNPLVLALMCALHHQGQLVGHNRADLIELFITLLFSRWDELRGVGPNRGLSARLRAAVGHFAWVSIYQQPDAPVMSRRQVMALFADHLASWCGPDVAHDEAKALLQFCTGRSWLLTEVGSDGVEPVYGFTHRTFLDFLAAEHVVAHNRDAMGIAEAVGQCLEIRGATSVAHLSITKFDQMTTGGADAVLNLLSRRQDDRAPWSGVPATSFAIWCMAAYRLRPVTLDWICREVVARASLEGLNTRFPIQYTDGDTGPWLGDTLLQQVVERTPPEFVDIIAHGIAAHAIQLAQISEREVGAAGHPTTSAGAKFWASRRQPETLIAALSVGDRLGNEPMLQLVAVHLRQMQLPEKTARLVRMMTEPGPAEIATLGAEWLFCAVQVCRYRGAPIATTLLRALGRDEHRARATAILEALAAPLLQCGRPWITYLNIEGLSVYTILELYDEWIPHFTIELLLSLPSRARDAAMLLALPRFHGYRWPEQLGFLNVGYNKPVMTDTARAGLASLKLSLPVAQLIEDVLLGVEKLEVWT